MKNIKSHIIWLNRVHTPTCTWERLFSPSARAGGLLLRRQVWSPSFSILCLHFFFCTKLHFVWLRHILPPLCHHCLSFDRWLLEFPQVAPCSPSFAAIALASLNWDVTESWESWFRNNERILCYFEEKKQKTLLACKHDFKCEFLLYSVRKRSHFKLPSSIT